MRIVIVRIACLEVAASWAAPLLFHRNRPGSFEKTKGYGLFAVLRVFSCLHVHCTAVFSLSSMQFVFSVPSPAASPCFRATGGSPVSPPLRLAPRSLLHCALIVPYHLEKRGYCGYRSIRRNRLHRLLDLDAYYTVFSRPALLRPMRGILLKQQDALHFLPLAPTNPT